MVSLAGIELVPGVSYYTSFVAGVGFDHCAVLRYTDSYLPHCSTTPYKASDYVFDPLYEAGGGTVVPPDV